MPKQNRIPIQYETFQRVDEDTNIDKLANGVLATLDDMVLNNPYGSATIRGGYQLQNNFQTNDDIKRMINVRDEDGQEYLIAGHGSRISSSTGGVWVILKSGLTGTGNFRFTETTKGIIFTNGSDKPFILSESDFAVSTDLEITPPDANGIIMQIEKNVLAGTNLDVSSIYTYMMIYVTEVGERSNPSNPFSFILANTAMPFSTDATHTRLYLDNLPIPTDARVSSKWLFRTEGWDRSSNSTGITFFLLKKLDNDTIDFEDNVADADLDLSEVIRYSRVPETAEFVIQSNNRIFFSNLNVHKKNFFTPYIVAHANSGDQTPTTITYEDGTDGNCDVFTDVPYAGGGGGNGGLHAARYYQYMYVYEDINGDETEPSYGEVFLTGGTLSNFRDVVISYLGLGAIGSNDFKNNPNLKFRNLYRTVGEVNIFTFNTKSFFLVSKTDIQHDDPPTVTTRPDTDYDYFDDLADASKDSGSGLGAIYAEVLQRWESAITWSQVERPSYILAESIKQIFNVNKGNPITGFLDDGNGVMIWKENSIIKLYHTGAPSNWYLRKIWNEFGCDVPVSLIKVGSTYFFSYRDRIYSMLSGQAPEDISYGRYASFRGMTIKDVVGNDQWIVYTTSKGSDKFQMVYDRVVRTWYKFNFGTTDLTCTLMKKYDDIFAGNKNLPHAIVGKRMFDYDDTVIEDEISGGGVAINPSMTFPLFRVKGTHSKPRNIILDWVKTGAGTLKFTFEDDSGIIVNNISSPDDTGLTRFDLALVGLDSTKILKLTLSGIIQQMNSIRIDVRADRQGVGV